MSAKPRKLVYLFACLAALWSAAVVGGCGSQSSGGAPDREAQSGGGGGGEEPTPTDQPTVKLSAASPAAITAGSSQVATITATVKEADGDVPPAGTAVTFALSPTTVATITGDPDGTDAQGVATATVSGLKVGTATVTAKALGITSKAATVAVSAPRITLELVDPAKATFAASDLGVGGAAVRVTVTDSASQPMQDVDVSVTTTLGTVAPSLVRTDAAGQGEVVTLTSKNVGTANVKGTGTALGGQSNILILTVDAAPLAQVVLTPSPSQIPPDGSTASEISVEAQDQFGNPVDGTVSLSSRDKTTGVPSGRLSPATVLLADGAVGKSSLTVDAPGTGSVTVEGAMTDPRYPATTVVGTTDVVLATTVVGEPASIRLAADPAIVSVWGVGQNSVATVTIEVFDTSGTPIAEGAGCSNNLEIMISGGPGAGENLQGREKGEPLILTSRGGKASATFNSGTRPGTVAFTVTVTKSAGGQTLTTPITAMFPILTVASGPPFSVTLAPGYKAKKDAGETHAILPVVALVEDVWGNAVPDGTPVSFGLVYNVKRSGSDGTVAKGGTDFTSALADFTAAGLSTEPPIDTLVLEDGASEGAYFLGAVVDDATLRSTSTFPADATGIAYVIGNSKGGPVLEGGTAVTNGVATINLRYPTALAEGPDPVYLYAETSDRQLGAVHKMVTPWPLPPP